MSYPILITVTTDRSGTTFLYQLIKKLYGNSVRVEHEILTHREARLRHFFRCYSPEALREAQSDAVINDLLEDIENSSKVKPVLIFGNTISHLSYNQKWCLNS